MLLIICRDEFALLTHAMACIDQDNWMTDVLDFKTYMVGSKPDGSTSKSRLKHYAAIV